MAARYSIEDYDAEDERAVSSSQPPLENMLSAAELVTTLLDTNGITYGIIGGFAMALRGSSRTTLDIDIAVAANMRQLWNMVEPEPRFKIPSSKLIVGVLRVFVQTGQPWDDCPDLHEIEVDLIQVPTKGTPRHLNENIELSGSVLGKNFYILNVLYMAKTKISNCAERGLARDFVDVEFLIENYLSEIKADRHSLPVDALEDLIQNEHLSKETRNHMKQFLGIDNVN